MKYIKVAAGVIGTLAFLIGIVWTLQGLNVLPGSSMTGDVQWAYRGAALAGAGATLVFWMTRTPGVLKGIALVLGALMILMGGVWILQGLNILPGSFMTGDIRWSYRGSILGIVGALLVLVSMRKPRQPPSS